MGPRERILAKIRKQQGRGGPAASDLEFAETYLRRRPRGPLPPVGKDLTARFCARAQASGSTTERISGWAAAPQAVARYVRANALPASGCVWPALAGLGWRSAGLALAARAAHGEDAIGVTGVFCAIAETGTLATISGPDTPASVSLLPETHCALVPAARIVPYMEDAWELARAELGQLPRAVNFISGPSRTADIEQTMVLGAHGPYRVHILLIEPQGG